MFRNGIVAGRRPFGQLRSAVPHSQYGLPFMCTACQARALSKFSSYKQKKPYKARNFMPVKGENFAVQVKQLEAHVQQMERNYAEELRKRAAEKQIPPGDLTDDMKDRAYAALMAPPLEAEYLPKPRELANHLSTSIRKRLGPELALVNAAEPQWAVILTHLEQTGGLEGMDANDVNRLLSCMDISQRAELSTRVLDMVKSSEVKVNTFTYDLLMISNAAVRNSAQVKSLFRQLVKEGLQPTVFSYSHLLKVYSQEGDVIAASKAFQEMQAAGIEPNLIVYTTLIQTCINRGDFDAAWQIFNLIKLKSTATAPDVSAYTLMIHACALKGETERAMDLFTDMTVRKELSPTVETYHSLIHACAVRKDYFSQAWEFALNMQKEGMKLNRMSLNVLVQACGRSGELTRARLLVRHMMAAEEADLMPDKQTYQNLLRAYSTYEAPLSRTRTSFLVKGDDRARRGTLKNAKRETDEAAFIQPNKELIRREKGSINITEKIPFFTVPVLRSPREVLDEAALIINWLRDMKPEIVDTQLLNSYLDVCIAQGSLSDLIACYRADFENPPNPFRPEKPSPQPHDNDPQAAADAALLAEIKLLRNSHTYKSALAAAVKFRDLPFAREVWADRMAYTRSPAYMRQGSSKVVNMWRERKRNDFEAELAMINVLALTNHFGEACERIAILAEEGGFSWTWDDLKTVYIRALQWDHPGAIACVQQYGKKPAGTTDELPQEY